MIQKHLLPILFFLLAALSVWNCTNNPVASGTEAGNPEITAAIGAMRSMLADDSSHKLSTHIPRELLNPSPQQPPMVLAKSSAKPCTVITIDTVINTKEEWIEIPLVVTDTLLNRYQVEDTLQTIQNGDTLISISQSLATDSIFVKDTLINKQRKITIDTLYIINKSPCAENQTPTFTTDSTLPTEKQKIDTIKYVPVMGEVVLDNDTVKLQFENDDDITVALSEENITTKQKAVQYTITISKSFKQTNGITGVATYSDADGDGQLYTASANAAPSVNVKGQWTQNNRIVIFTSSIADFSPFDERQNLNNLQSLQRLTLSPGSDTLNSVNFNRSQRHFQITGHTGADTLVKTIQDIHLDKTLAHIQDNSKQLIFRSMPYHRITIKLRHFSGDAQNIAQTFEASIEKTDSASDTFSGTITPKQHIKGVWTSPSLRLYILSVPGEPVKISRTEF